MRPSLAQELRDHDQHHLLTFWSDLSPAERDTLVEQIRGIDFAELSRLLAGQEAAIDWGVWRGGPRPPPAFRLSDTGGKRQFSADEARNRGAAALAEGHVGAILVAGGQGTRLGWPHPKGTYPIGPVSKSPLFQIIFERLVALGRRHGASRAALSDDQPGDARGNGRVSRRAPAIRAGGRRFARLLPGADAGRRCEDRPRAARIAGSRGLEPRRAWRNAFRACAQRRARRHEVARASSICFTFKSITRSCRSAIRSSWVITC